MLGSLYTKRILLDSMKGILSKPIRKRIYKKGFVTDIDWFTSNLKNLIYNNINLPKFINS